MGVSYEITDNTEEFKSALQNAIERGLEAIGVTAEGYAKEELTKQKAVDTGLLRNSITYAISGNKPAISSYKADKGGASGSYSGSAPDEKEKSVYIGTNVEYAPYVELGTFKMDARPFLKPAATNHSSEYKSLMEESMKNA